MMNETRRRSGWRATVLAALAFCAMAIGASARAADCTASSDGGGACLGVTVTSLYVSAGVLGGTTDVYLVVSGSMASLACTLDGGFITLPKSAPSFNATYAALLSVQASKAPFDLRVVRDNTTAKCLVAYALLH